MTHSTTGGLSQSVKDFIVNYIDSVEQVEILILLFVSHPKPWTVTEITERILSTPSSVGQRIKLLVQQNFLVQNGEQYSFNTANTHAGVLPLLVEAYKDRRIRVIEAIFSKPVDRLRDFSDAFKINKKDEE